MFFSLVDFLTGQVEFPIQFLLFFLKFQKLYCTIHTQIALHRGVLIPWYNLRNFAILCSPIWFYDNISFIINEHVQLTLIICLQTEQKRLTLSQSEIVLKLEAGEKQGDLAKAFGVQKQAINYLKTKAAAIKEAGFSNKKDSKPLKTAEKFRDADDLLFTSFWNMKNQDEHINSNLLVAPFKMLLIKKDNKISSDEACDGWIHRWRERRGIIFKVIHKENKACPDYTEVFNSISMFQCRGATQFKRYFQRG